MGLRLIAQQVPIYSPQILSFLLRLDSSKNQYFIFAKHSISDAKKKKKNQSNATLLLHKYSIFSPSRHRQHLSLFPQRSKPQN